MPQLEGVCLCFLRVCGMPPCRKWGRQGPPLWVYWAIIAGLGAIIVGLLVARCAAPRGILLDSHEKALPANWTTILSRADSVPEWANRPDSRHIVRITPRSASCIASLNKHNHEATRKYALAYSVCQVPNNN